MWSLLSCTFYFHFPVHQAWPGSPCRANHGPLWPLHCWCSSGRNHCQQGDTARRVCCKQEEGRERPHTTADWSGGTGAREVYRGQDQLHNIQKDWSWEATAATNAGSAAARPNVSVRVRYLANLLMWTTEFQWAEKCVVNFSVYRISYTSHTKKDQQKKTAATIVKMATNYKRITDFFQHRYAMHML